MNEEEIQNIETYPDPIDEEENTKYIGLNDKGIIIHSDDIKAFSQEAAIFDKKTGEMMNPENGKEADIKKLRKSLELLKSDTLYHQEQYLSLLWAVQIDSKAPIKKQYRWTKEHMEDKELHIPRVVYKRIELSNSNQK